MWLGKIVGALFGALALGPFGALLGTWIGHQFDKGHRLASWLPNTHTQAHNAFFEATFSVLGHIAKADGLVSKDEIRLTEEIIQNLRLNPTLRQEAIRWFTLGKSNAFKLEETLDNLRRRYHNNRALLQLFVDIQLQMVQTDGTNASKQHLIRTICQRLNVEPFVFYSSHAHAHQSRQNSRAYSPAHGPHTSDPYTVLGVSRDAAPADIKRAYRKLMSQNHPDKLVAKGLPAQMLKLATEKTQAIQAAYESIKQQKGFT